MDDFFSRVWIHVCICNTFVFRFKLTLIYFVSNSLSIWPSFSYLDILEGGFHQTAIATLITLWLRAINQILLGQIWQGPKINLHVPFKRASRREGPARAALALVLDVGNGAGSAPIDSFLECFIWVFFGQGQKIGFSIFV